MICLLLFSPPLLVTIFSVLIWISLYSVPTPFGSRCHPLAYHEDHCVLYQLLVDLPLRLKKRQLRQSNDTSLTSTYAYPYLCHTCCAYWSYWVDWEHDQWVVDWSPHHPPLLPAAADRHFTSLAGGGWAFGDGIWETGSKNNTGYYMVGYISLV